MARIYRGTVGVSILALLLVASSASSAVTTEAVGRYNLDQTTVDSKGDPGVLTVANDDGWGATRVQHQAIWVFELQDLGGQEILAADLGIAYLRDVNIVTDEQTLDLFVRNSLGATGDVTTSDYIAQADDPNPVGWTLLQDDFITGDTAGATVQTLSATGQANLLTYLKDNYVAGQYLLISAAMDTNGVTGNFDRFEFNTVNSRVDGDPPIGQDELIVDVVPEPTTMGILGLGLLGLIKRRR